MPGMAAKVVITERQRRLWFPDEPGRAPTVLRAPHDGVLAVIRAIPVTEAGDSAFVLGQPIEANALQ